MAEISSLVDRLVAWIDATELWQAGAIAVALAIGAIGSFFNRR